MEDLDFLNIKKLDNLGVSISNFDLKSHPSENIINNFKKLMEEHGFIVFKNQDINHVDFLQASQWFGELHSMHGIHPESPDPNIFRLSNDTNHGIFGVGAYWHNDGSFLDTPFSYAGYHIIRPAENGGGTYFSHLGRVYDSLSNNWSNLYSVNSTSNVIYPLVFEKNNRKLLWLQLSMVGAVIEKISDSKFRLLDETELKNLCREYNKLLNSHSSLYEYEKGDCVFVDNILVSHKASPASHLPAETQGLRILHRSTIRGNKITHDLPEVDLEKPSIFGPGFWKKGGVGINWLE